MLKDISRCSERDINRLCQNGRVTGKNQAKKTWRELVETMKVGLRTVQRIIKNWTDIGEPSFIVGKDMVGKKSSMTGYHLNI